MNDFLVRVADKSEILRVLRLSYLRFPPFLLVALSFREETPDSVVLPSYLLLGFEVHDDHLLELILLTF